MNIFKAIPIFIKILKDEGVICNIEFGGDIRISACDRTVAPPGIVNCKFWETYELYYLYSSKHNKIPLTLRHNYRKPKINTVISPDVKPKLEVISTHPIGSSDTQRKPNPNIKPPTPRLVQEGYDPNSI